MQVVAYCRVSSEEQAEKDISIPAQRKAIRRWVEQLGYHTLQEFVDEGQSAYAPADKRPGFREMISYCRKNKVNLILVHKLDRFSRNREESILFKSLLRKHNVTVKSISEDYDPETPQGFLYEGMIEVINQFFSMNLATETLKGMRENAERGFHNGGRTPYGYRLEVITENGRERRRLVHGPEEEVATIREMFRLAVAEGMGSKSIAGVLNRQKILPPMAKGWSGSAVTSILSNRVYVGDLLWRKRKTMGRSKRQRSEKGDMVITENAHEPIVDRESFEKRMKMASARRFDTPRAKEGHVEHLLGRLIKCGHCGGNFVGRRQKYRTRHGEERYRSHYYCNNYLTMGTAVCTSHPIAAAWADGLLVKLLRARFCEPEALAELANRVRERLEARRDALGRNPQMVARKLEDIDRRIRNFYKAIGDGVDPAVCRTHIDELTAKRAQVEVEVALLSREDHHQRALEKCLAEMHRFAAAFNRGFDQLPLGVRRQVILHFVEKIEVVDRRVFQVTLRVPIDGDGVKLLTEAVETAIDGENDCQNENSGYGAESVFTEGQTGGAFTASRQTVLTMV